MEDDLKREILGLLEFEKEARAKALQNPNFSSLEKYGYIAGFSETIFKRIEDLLVL